MYVTLKFVDKGHITVNFGRFGDRTNKNCNNWSAKLAK